MMAPGARETRHSHTMLATARLSVSFCTLPRRGSHNGGAGCADPISAVQLLHSGHSEGCMATNVGRLTIWSIIAVVAIIIVALYLVNR